MRSNKVRFFDAGRVEGCMVSTTFSLILATQPATCIYMSLNKRAGCFNCLLFKLQPFVSIDVVRHCKEPWENQLFLSSRSLTGAFEICIKVHSFPRHFLSGCWPMAPFQQSKSLNSWLNLVTHESELYTFVFHKARHNFYSKMGMCHGVPPPSNRMPEMIMPFMIHDSYHIHSTHDQNPNEEASNIFKPRSHCWFPNMHRVYK